MLPLLGAIIAVGFLLIYVFLITPEDTRMSETAEFLSQAMLEYHEMNSHKVLSSNSTVAGSGAAVIDGTIHDAFPNIAGYQTAYYYYIDDEAPDQRTVVILTWSDPTLIGDEKSVNRMIRILHKKLKHDSLKIDAGMYDFVEAEQNDGIPSGSVGSLRFNDAALSPLELHGLPAILSLHSR